MFYELLGRGPQLESAFLLACLFGLFCCEFYYFFSFFFNEPLLFWICRRFLVALVILQMTPGKIIFHCWEICFVSLPLKI